jgi:small subunit ribosomal protein S6
MNKYELVYIVDAHLGPEAKDEVNKQVVDTVAKAEGKIINSNVWFERQRISFPIKKVQDGTYYLVNWEGNGNAPTKLRQTLRLNERVLRFLIINANDHKVPAPPKVEAKAA